MEHIMSFDSSLLVGEHVYPIRRPEDFLYMFGMDLIDIDEKKNGVGFQDGRQNWVLV
jgi:hypothetical protein